jgi:septum formation protein
MLIHKKLILGSQSPRRSQLLAEAGYDFEVRISDVDECLAPDLEAEKQAEHLATKKAMALSKTLTSTEVLLTADTVVILDHKIYNKPTDYADAVRILSELADRTHTVTTGVCIITLQERISFTVSTLVTFDSLDMGEINYYIDRFKPFDKAGAYGVQDWIGLCKVRKIEGSYSNVMGLPMWEVYGSLKNILTAP